MSAPGFVEATQKGTGTKQLNTKCNLPWIPDWPAWHRLRRRHSNDCGSRTAKRKMRKLCRSTGTYLRASLSLSEILDEAQGPLH